MQRNDNERAHVRVSGLVQGVFFRDSARKKALELGLTGYVTNTPDGDVEALFEGPTDHVREMVLWCGEGPPHATVEDVEADYGPAKGDLSGFEVR